MTNQEHTTDKNSSTVAWDNPRDESRTEQVVSPSPALLGVVAGVVLSIYLGIINGAMDMPSAGAKIFKYVLLGGFLTWALVRVERMYSAGRIVPRALVHAAWINGIAAAVVAFANLIFYGINPEWGFEKFSEGNEGGLTAIAYSGIQLFEIFAIGMIIAFILIQFLKRRTSAEKV